jgi:hypothetical protein
MKEEGSIMDHGRMTTWMARGFSRAVLLAMAGACSSGPTPRETRPYVFTNGGFEMGAPNAAPQAWTVTDNLNANGVIVESPETLVGLQLAAGGKSLTTTIAAVNQPDPDLGAGASLRVCRYGNQCARVNFHSSTNFMTGGTNNGKNINTLSQIMTVGPGDVDPSDGQVHIRFVDAPVLQNPAHPADEQPYYFVELTDLTKNTILYTDFNLSAQAGVPWKTVNGGTANEIDYVDWSLVDISPGSSALAMGDMVELQIIASGCSPGGHFGEIYVDGLGSTIPGLFLSGTGPAQANAGTNITYDLTYKNGSAAAETGVVIDFTTPPNTTLQGVVPPAGVTCVGPGVGAPGTVVCTLAGALAAGAGGSLTVTVNIDPAATGTITAGNYQISSTQETPLLGPHIYTLIGCTLDSQCPVGDWCHETAPIDCTPTLANGIAVPTDASHANPTLNGMCTAAAGALVCTSGVCDMDNACGYANDDGACTAANGATVCRSGACDPDLKCGYAVGDGPCTVATGPVVCRSGACSTNGKCEPAGGCDVDADCTGGKWCDESTHVCSAQVANGTLIPTDPSHANPVLNGTCTVPAGTLVCISSVCDTGDNECGYANGDGPCTSVNGTTVCRSGVCSANGTCEAPGGCNVDADCPAGTWCNESAHTCTAQLANGVAMPTDAPHTNPTLNEICTVAAATLVCHSVVCDIHDNECGYANGDGPCTATDGAIQCRSALCTATASAPGICVACLNDSQCSDTTPACNTTTHVCVQCTTSSTCPTADPVCDPSSSTCVPCDGDFGSTATDPCGSMGEPFCFLTGKAAGECGKCATNADCQGHSGKFCDTTSGLCTAECGTDTDCLSSQWCNAAPGGRGMCEAKEVNGKPLPSTPTTVATCSESAGKRVCVSTVCDTKTNKCGFATGDGPCASNVECVDGMCDEKTHTCGVMDSGVDAGAKCHDDSDCATGRFCASDGACTPSLPTGGTCDRARECQSDDCTAGVCSTVVGSGNGLLCAVREPGGFRGTGTGGLVGLLVGLAGAGRRRRRKGATLG